MYIFLTGARLDNLVPYNIMAGRILKWKCASGSKELCQKYLEAAERERASGSAFSRNSQSSMQKLTRTCSSDCLHS